MKVIRAFPPNFAQIAAAFPVKGVPGIIYAYGDRIYAPGSKGSLPPWILAHEEVHGKQQTPTDFYYTDPVMWWAAYISSPDFRLDMEIPAHRAEWQTYPKLGNGPQYLSLIADRLSGPLYGNLISKERAIEEITRA